MSIIDKKFTNISATEGVYLEFELKKMLVILAQIIDAESQVDPIIFKSTPKFGKIVPLAYECFEELGW